MLKTEARNKIFDNIAETIGSTPVVRLHRLCAFEKVNSIVMGKCEFFNPLASVKDRIAVNIITHAEKSGKLKPGGVVVEATSGNTGIGLAFACAAKGYQLIIVMPEHMSDERKKMLRHFGVELILTPRAGGMKAAVEKADEIVNKMQGAVLARQFSNEANVDAHIQTTVEEIYADTAGKLNYFIAGVGTGGTITAMGKALKPKVPGLKVIAVEPEESPVLSSGQPGPHGIQGIGAGFVPEIFDMGVIDEIVTVSTQQAIETARLATKLEGLPLGISGGANLRAALELAKRVDDPKVRIMTVFPSFVERYLSTPLFED